MTTTPTRGAAGPGSVSDLHSLRSRQADVNLEDQPLE